MAALYYRRALHQNREHPEALQNLQFLNRETGAITTEHPKHKKWLSIASPTLYLNIIPFGKHAFGIKAAAQTYYGQNPEKLNLAQLAMLAGIPQAPEAGNPINGPRRAIDRRNLILSRMLDQRSSTKDH